VRGLLLVGLAALALAGCSSQSDANPAPVKLDDLNLTPYVGKPCSLLDADQLADLHIAKAEVDGIQTSEVGTCVLTLSPTTSGTLRAAVDRPKSTVTFTMKIAGYPAAEGARDNGCGVAVSVSDTRQISVSVGGVNACHLAENVATSAIATIKRLSP